MKIVRNYSSVVTVGGFNPSIFTPDFLTKECKIKLGDSGESRVTPVLSDIKSGNIEFLMELNRFQILVRNLSDFNNQFPLETMLCYLEILKYTPLSLLGINFNYTLMGCDSSELVKKFSDVLDAGDAFNVEPSGVNISAKKINGNALRINEATISHETDKLFKNSIRLTFSTDNVTINDNYEMNGLDKEREKIKEVLNYFPTLLKSNNSLKKKIEGLLK